MFPLLQSLAHWLQPFLVPLCFISAWGIVFLVISNLWSMSREGISTVQRLHQIPCANCQFFTGDYHLKCTVNPTAALSEAAISCVDYTPKQTSPYSPSR